MAQQQQIQKTRQPSRERDAYLREYEDEQQAARTYEARQAVKRARRIRREAEEFLARTEES